VTYEQKKTGRKVTHITFSFKEKTKSISHESTDIPKEFYKLTDAQINMFGNQLSRLHEFSHLAREGESYEILLQKSRKNLEIQNNRSSFYLT
jgi:hypothetical protein